MFTLSKFWPADAGTPPADQPLIDDVGVGAETAISLNRLLRDAYGDTSNIMRIRRSSDNAEANIPMVDGLTDRTAIATHVGANNGFLVTVYDQSGNGRNWTQSTASAQPLIVSSGTILVDSDNKIIARYDGVNDYLLMAASALTDSARISTFGVFNNVSVTSGEVLIGITDVGGFNRLWVQQLGATTLRIFDLSSDDTSACPGAGTFFLLRTSFDSTTTLMQINNVTAVSFASDISGITFEEFYIGAIDNFESMDSFANIEFSEYVIWHSDSIGAGQVTTAKDNIYAFYGAIAP